ncbi:MAG TPA: aminoacyl--tRNA ligase-related protein [Patescibacteria group bacterium]|nr:aminoacyl--tRNA ligase-related protein [Patescibacteria group bacterium]
MKLSQLFTKTSKTVPADETADNAKLLIRAGYVHKEMAGVYDYLPLGKKVVDNITSIIREEMDALGAQEIQMSVLQNMELWQKTGRWDDKIVDDWFKTRLVNGSEIGLGLTHEEPITNMLRRFVSSYKDLPLYVYQIQTKFRNELRAKSGLLRGRELLMKDMYSYSRSVAEHEQFYEKAIKAYEKVYQRLGIGDITYMTFASGGIFTKFSHEFQTLSHVGEDTIYVSESKKLAINKEVYNDEVLSHLGVEKKHLKEERAVEVGNIFSLGSRYADALGLHFTDKDGREMPVIMGCYGIGISRLVGLLAEHFADEKGLVWPVNIAPALVYIVRLGSGEKIVQQADALYELLIKNKISAIYDDRDVQSGEKLNNADLLGIPYRVVVSEKTTLTDKVEVKARSQSEVSLMTEEALLKLLSRS